MFAHLSGMKTRIWIPFKKSYNERIKLFPEYENLILAYYGRWEEMLGGEISGTVKILKIFIKKENLKSLH